MKKITCSLNQEKMFKVSAFNSFSVKDAEEILKEILMEYDLIPHSVKLLGLRKIQITFQDNWNNDWILRVLVNIFSGFGGVEVTWDIFDEPFIIY